MTLPTSVYLPAMALRETVEVLKPNLVSKPLGETQQDWKNATVASTVKGMRTPIDDKIQALFTAQGTTVSTRFILEGAPVLAAENRLRVGSTVYIVRHVKDYGALTEVLAEVVGAT